MKQLSDSAGKSSGRAQAQDVSLPTVIDLFAGVGGLSLGALRAGFNLSLAVENDPHAANAHHKNFPKVEHSDADISTLDGESMLNAAGLKLGALDGLIGGPPCQGFSAIGSRNTLDPRNNLYRKFYELVAASRPRFFLAENVLGILDPQYDDARRRAFACVEDDYILLPPMRLKASDYGAPTNRERVFFIGYREGGMMPVTLAQFEAQKATTKAYVRDALSGLPVVRCDWQNDSQGWRVVERLPETFYGRRITGCVPPDVGDPDSLRRFFQDGEVSGCLGTVHTKTVKERFARLKFGQSDKISRASRLNPDGFCPTLRAGTAADRGSFQSVRPVHPTSPRVITPREAARLQGFPDWFRFAPSKWHSFRQIGNSVSPLVAEALLTVLFRNLR